MYFYKVSTEGEVRFNASRFGTAMVKISIDSEKSRAFAAFHHSCWS